MNEWEIPKGRRKQYENNKECAKREFQEETNIKFDQYIIYDNIIPLIEEYKGINGVRYKQVYYIGRVNELLELSINMENKDQYTEIKNIKWLTQKEALDSINFALELEKDQYKLQQLHNLKGMVSRSLAAEFKRKRDFIKFSISYC